ncbi:sulfotransferase family 2 domain-containing protein [Brevirhabdus sp.]|uniref:sulfotransferase family 2 domain-containing protein n=1 Tax=Brevirhabdus sp. TaxID=2004514 RepID=UPI004058AA34
MIVSHRHRFVFFSNPKTGSESIRRMLAPWNEVAVRPYRAAAPFYPHMSPAEAYVAFQRAGWDFTAYRRITCLRDPYPRLVSLYRMIAAVDGIWRLRQRWGRPLGLGAPSFARWLAAARPRGRGGGGRAHQRWRRHGAWSAEAWTGGGRLITDVLRLEHLGRDLPPLMTELGLTDPAQAPSPAIPWDNRRTAADWRGYYTAASARLVARRYAWDFTHFYPGADQRFLQELKAG